MTTTTPKRTSDLLISFYNSAKDELARLGYSEISVRNISLNGKLLKSLGRYFRLTKDIEINKDFFLYADEKSIIGVIIHEIIHNISQPVDSMYHTGEWLKIAKDVSSRSGYIIDVKNPVEPFRHLIPQKFKYEHEFQCKCGRRQYVKSKFEILPQRYIPKCDLEGLIDNTIHEMSFIKQEKIFKYL